VVATSSDDESRPKVYASATYSVVPDPASAPAEQHSTRGFLLATVSAQLLMNDRPGDLLRGRLGVVTERSRKNAGGLKNCITSILPTARRGHPLLRSREGDARQYQPVGVANRNRYRPDVVVEFIPADVVTALADRLDVF